MRLASHSSTIPISKEFIWKGFANLVQRFGLQEKEALILLGDMPRASYMKGMSEGSTTLDRDKRDRVSYLLGIYKGLRLLFDDSTQAVTWINRKNSLPPFYGMTPKEYMLEGSVVRLAEVRQFLDVW